jgi:outer membrane protein assembly factor BamE (lipoprotein component of BamABCDE complex)
MKTLPLLVVLIAMGALAAGAASQMPPSDHPAAGGIAAPHMEDTVEPSETPPHRGMTRTQVRKLYGDPDNVRGEPAGETWFYFFNRMNYFIPFYYAKPRTAMFHFNGAGILTDFQYSH